MAKTPTPADDAPALGADDYKTEAEKAPADPVGKPEEPTKAETMDDLGIGAKDPYPSKED